METTQQASEPPIKAPDFGEPWHSGGEYVYSRDDKQVHLYPMRLRIAQCVNATAGMADPAKEIQAMRDAQIELDSNFVALFKLPIPLKKLAGIIDHMEGTYGNGLRMQERPKGWLQFFTP
jgi:hypothetical protein